MKYQKQCICENEVEYGRPCGKVFIAIIEVEDMYEEYIDQSYLQQLFNETKCPDCRASD